MKTLKQEIEFLENEHLLDGGEMVLDDDLPDAFSQWIMDLDEIAISTIMARYRESLIKQIENLDITGVDNANFVKTAIVRHLSK